MIFLKHVYYRDLSTVRTAEAFAVSVHSRYCSHRDKLETTSGSKMVVQYFEQNTRGKHFSSRGRQLEKPASSAAAAKVKFLGPRTDLYWRLQTMWDEKVNALQEKNCVIEHDP